MNTQLTFGLMSGIAKAEPIAVGDVLVKADHSRWVVESVDSNINGEVYICVNQKDGRSGILLPKEVAYRSR